MSIQYVNQSELLYWSFSNLINSQKANGVSNEESTLIKSLIIIDIIVQTT